MEHAEGKTHVYEAFPFLFTEFEIESDNLNGKVHYTTKDGKYAIAYNTCRQWVVSILDKHGRYTVINTGPHLFDDVIFLCFRGNCAGKIYTDDDHTCPNEISHTWKYKNNYWTAANEGVKIVCIPGPAMMRAKNKKSNISDEFFSLRDYPGPRNTLKQHPCCRCSEYDDYNSCNYNYFDFRCNGCFCLR